MSLKGPPRSAGCRSCLHISPAEAPLPSCKKARSFCCGNLLIWCWLRKHTKFQASCNSSTADQMQDSIRPLSARNKWLKKEFQKIPDHDDRVGGGGSPASVASEPVCVQHLELNKNMCNSLPWLLPHQNPIGLSDHKRPRPQHVHNPRTNLTRCLHFAQVVTCLILCSLHFLLHWPLPHHVLKPRAASPASCSQARGIQASSGPA